MADIVADLERDKHPLEIVIDVAFISMIFVTFGHLVKTVRPTQRGFFCEDESIRHPFQPETVTISVVVGYCLATTLIAFVIVEASSTRYRKYTFRARRRVLRLTGLFMFGLVVTLIVTEVIKLAVGRLRPHFVDVCRPQFDSSLCTDDERSVELTGEIQAPYIEEYVCDESATKRLVNARKSFPSGHASICFFMTTFLSHYFDNRLESLDGTTSDGRATLPRRVVSRLLQLALWIIATAISASRVTDNMHHVTDVIAGAAVGLIVALWTVTIMDKYFRFNMWLSEPPDNLIGGHHHVMNVVRQSEKSKL